MKFTCVTEYLKKALANAERFAGKNITLPVLANVLLEVEGDTVRITATNLESAIKIVVHGSASRIGKVCVPVRVLSSFVQSIGDEKIQIEEKQGGLVIKTDLRDTRIHGVPVEDFPLFPNIKKTHSLTLPSLALSEAITRVLPAVSISEFKPELNGIAIHVSSALIRFAATDTFRLAEKTILLDQQRNIEPFSFILPAKIASELGRILGKDDVITISIGENQILFESDDYVVISRLIEGNFPEYSAIIPKNFETSCFVSKSTLTDAVRASSIFTSKLREVTTVVKNKHIEVRSLNQDIGEYKNLIPCSSSGKDLVVGFNYHYFLDGLQATSEEDVFLGLNSEQSPSLIKNKSDGSFLYVLMPIRLS